jgi:hypothetical protein
VRCCDNLINIIALPQYRAVVLTLRALRFREESLRAGSRVDCFCIDLFPLTSFAVDAQTCKLPANAVSISEPGAAQGATDVHIEDSVTEMKSVHGVIHLDLRYDGLTPLSELCASVHLSNNEGSPLDASVALSVPNVKEGSVNFERAKTCLKLAPPWPGYQSSSFDLHLRTKADSVPASGFVLIDAAIEAKEPPPEQGTTTKATRVNLHRRLQANP